MIVFNNGSKCTKFVYLRPKTIQVQEMLSWIKMYGDIFDKY